MKLFSKTINHFKWSGTKKRSRIEKLEDEIERLKDIIGKDPYVYSPYNIFLTRPMSVMERLDDLDTAYKALRDYLGVEYVTVPAKSELRKLTKTKGSK